MTTGMPKTQFIGLNKHDRLLQLTTESESTSVTQYSENLTRETRPAEIDNCIDALLAHNFAKAREHALAIRNGSRLTTGPLFRFSDPSIEMVGYYDASGRLISERKMTTYEKARS